MARRTLVLTLVLTLAAMAWPAPIVAGQQNNGQISGTAMTALNAALPNTTVRLRNVDTGAEVATTTTNGLGQFTFAGVAPGNYVIEIVDANGKVVGTSAAVLLAPAGSATGLTVMLAAEKGAVAGFFTSTAGIVVLAAAGAGITAAAVAARRPASPSR